MLAWLEEDQAQQAEGHSDTVRRSHELMSSMLAVGVAILQNEFAPKNKEFQTKSETKNALRVRQVAAPRRQQFYFIFAVGSPDPFCKTLKRA